jgi:hypothetical protein
MCGEWLLIYYISSGGQLIRGDTPKLRFGGGKQVTIKNQHVAKCDSGPRDEMSGNVVRVGDVRIAYKFWLGILKESDGGVSRRVRNILK